MACAVNKAEPIDLAMDKHEFIQKMQKEVYALQRDKKIIPHIQDFGFGLLQQSFPDKVFPTGAVHELISYGKENAAATTGFMAVLAGKLMQEHGSCLWVSTKRTVFPPALKHFGINPQRVIFIDLNRQKEALWVMEEALKCQSLSIVIGEINNVSFNDSRRFQLAVEKSSVTGLLHRYKPRSENTLACVSRWKVSVVKSATGVSMPGIGFSRWHVELLKVRNGKPNSWSLEWSRNNFQYISGTTEWEIKKRKTA